MCGIIGYIGKEKCAKKVLIEGLKCLEYRGYDSAGVAIFNGTSLDITKAIGQIVNLQKKLENEEEGLMGLGHTRWATHGTPSEVNSHPHKSGKITLVHNGIIENYADLKNDLSTEGVTFVSDTDSEVAAALLDYLYYKYEDVLTAIVEFKKMVRGSYALAFIVEGLYDRLYVIKNLSPLIIGIGENCNFVASDIHALLNRTNKYISLENGEYSIVTEAEITIYDRDGEVKKEEIKTFSGAADEMDKGEFEHFMLKEIYDEPTVIKNLLSTYVENKKSKLPDLKEYKSVTIVACGSAMHAGLIGKYLIEKYINIPVSVELASEFKYKQLFLSSQDVIIAISQSGETADTLAAVEIAKSLGTHTIGIVNVLESSIARTVDEVIYTLAGREVAVATTKAYLAQVFILFLIAVKNELRSSDYKQLSKLPVIVERIINDRNVYKDIADSIYKHEDIFFIGRLIDYALCMEGSLKLKEISYIHSDAYAAGELKHGTISLVEEGTPVIAVITEPSIADKTISNIKEVKARGAYVVLIISEECNAIGDFYDKKVVIPKEVYGLSSILSTIPLQLIAYEVAKLRDCAIDKPRNLAKSVTVE